MISLFELITLFVLLTILIIIGWLYYIEYKRGDKLTDWRYTRGANLIEGTNNNQIQLLCDEDHVICVDKATQICSNPDTNNFESTNLDYSSTGISDYGNFNPFTTASLTQNMKQNCDGKSNCTYTFTPLAYPNGVTCNGKNQLISTYTCVPKDSATCYSAIATKVPNYWEQNNYFLYQPDKSCVAAKASNAIGWKYMNTINYNVYIMLVGSVNSATCKEYNQVMTLQPATKAQQYASWIESQDQNSYKTLFTNSVIALKQNGSTQVTISTIMPDIEPGDVLEFYSSYDTEQSANKVTITNERTGSQYVQYL